MVSGGVVCGGDIGFEGGVCGLGGGAGDGNFGGCGRERFEREDINAAINSVDFRVSLFWEGV